MNVANSTNHLERARIFERASLFKNIFPILAITGGAIPARYQRNVEFSETQK